MVHDGIRSACRSSGSPRLSDDGAGKAGVMRFGARDRRRRGTVQVRGCGCCLPLALGLLSVPSLMLRQLVRRLR